MIIARRRVYVSKHNVPLIGVIDGNNTLYTTPDKFNPGTLAVYYNGQRLMLTNDFTITESAGPGTGFDTVHFLLTPVAGDNLLSDYATNT